jgi:N-acetylglucosaminyl-diphospho-decaprenol L-rhamnosyltransferase
MAETDVSAGTDTDPPNGGAQAPSETVAARGAAIGDEAVSELRRESAPVRGDVSVVVVTLDALPWLEQSLASVESQEIIVVDHGSTDGTIELVRARFPRAQLVEQENRGLAAGWNRGLVETTSPYVLILNADAWLLPGSLETLAAHADRHPQAAVVGPRLRNPDGTLQRSVRGFPTLWRLATEYLFLRKLAPRTRALNAFYAGGFAHDVPREADFLMGACLLVRREAIDAVGPLDESFFLFSEETDWCYRFRQAGWTVLFTPEAEAVHVGGASHGGRFFREQVLGHVRFLAKHRGEREAERARRLLVLALRLRGLLFRGKRGRDYADAARFLASAPARTLLERPTR